MLRVVLTKRFGGKVNVAIYGILMCTIELLAEIVHIVLVEKLIIHDGAT